MELVPLVGARMTTPTPPPAMVDTLTVPLLLKIRDCLVAELERTPAGGPMFRYLWWGPTPPVMDGCSCSGEDAGGARRNGQAWVRLVELSPETGTTSFTEGRNNVQACDLGVVATIGIGSYRCIPISERGEPLPEEVENGTGLMMHADMAAWMRVLSCCDMWKDDTLKIGRASFMRTNPIRAADCAGGELLFRLPLYGTVRCTPPPVPEP